MTRSVPVAVASILFDVTRGSNGQRATEGYEMASGPGTPKVANLASDICTRAA